MGGAASQRGKDKRPRRTEGYKQAWARRNAATQPTTPSREGVPLRKAAPTDK